jgi:hypothetical protein
MLMNNNPAEMERVREAYWARFARTAPVKLRWRAIAVRHCFHVPPGESILEVGAANAPSSSDVPIDTAC